MKSYKYVNDRFKELDDNDRVIIILYAYGMYVDDSRNGVKHNRNYITKKDIMDNITNQDWYNSYYVSEKVNKDGDLILYGSMTK